MTITCPHCGFFREIDADRVPSRAIRVTCPRCRRSFPLPRGSATGTIFGPAEPEGETVADKLPYPSATTMPKAGFWTRAIAAIVDSLLVALLHITMGIALGMATNLLGNGLDVAGQNMVTLIVGVFGTALSVAYYVFFIGYCGQTPGKMALRIKVIRTNGSEIGYGRAALRELPGKFLSAILLGIGYLMVAFDAQKQGLHDKIADTYVIKL